MIFAKKSGGLLFSAKVQNHLGSSEISRNLHKIQKIPPKAAATKRELICVSQVVYYLCGGVFPSFQFRVSVAASQKKLDFDTPKMEKALFVVRNENQPLWRYSPSQWPRACPIWHRSDKLCHAHGRI
jgi:hypothetical protein